VFRTFARFASKRIFITGSTDCFVKVWDLIEGKDGIDPNLRLDFRRKHATNAIETTADLQHIVIADSSNEVTIYSLT